MTRRRAGTIAIEGRRIILPTTGRVRLWMLAEAALWALLQESCVLRVDPALVSFPEWLPRYDWLRGQMARRLPGYGGSYP